MAGKVVSKHGVVAAALMLCASSSTACAAPAPAPKKLYGGLNQWAGILNTAGIKLTGANVDKVMLGTPAYFAGLRDKDVLLKCDVQDKVMKVTFDRGGKKYAVTLPMEMAALQPGVAVDKPPPATPTKFDLGAKQAIETLKDFDVIVFLDCSGSMGQGFQSKEMSKWDWAKDHIKDFNSKLNAAASKNITLVPFNSSFNIIPNCTPSDLNTLFEQRKPDGGTDLATPLEDVVNQHLRVTDRPAVLVVLHDGISDNDRGVQSVLEHAAQNLIRGKLFINFIQIGDDTEGADHLKEMESANFGGKDFVKVELFDDVERRGLAQVVAQAIKERIPAQMRPVNDAGAPRSSKPVQEIGKHK